MRVNTEKSAEILVIGESKLLSKETVRRRLMAANAVISTLKSNREQAFADKVIQGIAETNSSWVLVLLPGRPTEHSDLISKLIATGVDDVITVAGKDDLGIIEQSLAQAQSILALAAEIAISGHLHGQSRMMRAVHKAMALCIMSHTLPVLISGETGTGKGQVAKAMHSVDPLRLQHPFYTLDCGSITDTLFGSELFGHVRGAYTGALNNRRGAFECAERGTLLLDEIGELSLPTQSYLLNALQERAYRPVGSDKSSPIQCRIVAATNRCLNNDITKQHFRRDLYYRLNGFSISLPALRDHSSDIADLFRCFVSAARAEASMPALEPAVDDVLRSYAFPGNVRELESIAQYVALRMGTERQVRLAHLPFERMQLDDASEDSKKSVDSMVREGMKMREIESEIARQATLAALSFRASRQPEASRTDLVNEVARSLGVSPRTIYNKLNGTEKPL